MKKADRKPRLIEPPLDELKSVQRRIKTLLNTITVPDNVFSGVKGRSYIDNARHHIEQGQTLNLYKIDISAFFPSISRGTVYNFFLTDMKCSPDIASILTSLTTIDLTRIHPAKATKLYRFLDSKGACYNHLISGAPTSQLLSYLVNHRMFDEIQELSSMYGIVMTIYVDDLVFSSKNVISSKFRNSVISIIRKNGYRVSKGKVKGYSKTYPKLVTGVIIDKNGNTIIKNSLRKKIIDEFNFLRSNPTASRKGLQGLVNAARQIDKTAYPNIRRFAFDQSESL